MPRQRSRLRRDATQRIPRSILDDLNSSRDEANDNAPDDLDPEAPTRYTDSPAGINLNDPVGSVTGWLNHEGRIYNTLGLEGELDIIAQSDEKPMGVKVGTLGYGHNVSAHSPFELLPEMKAGAAVFLTLPVSATNQSKGGLDPTASFSNHSMAMLMTRSTPLGLGLLPNLNFTGACSTSRATELSGLVHVLIKAGSPSSNSNPETLCATFYLRSAWTPMNDDAPMLLEQCNSSLIPGETTGPGNFTATQLWQYDPKTHELRPILWSESGMSSESTPSSTSESNNPVASDMLGVDRENMTLQSSRSSVESARTIITQSSVAAQQMQGYTFSGATPTYSSKTATPSQAKVRRKSSHMEVGGHVAPPYTAVVIVEPYTLVFVPRTTAGPGTMLPDSPV